MMILEMLEVDADDRCNEEDIKMQDMIKEYYDAAIRRFNDYWAQQVMKLGNDNSSDEDEN